MVQKALNACKKPYSKDNETAAVEAVEDWLQSADDKIKDYKSGAKVADDKGSTMLKVASENGYPQ